MHDEAAAIARVSEVRFIRSKNHRNESDWHSSNREGTRGRVWVVTGGVDRSRAATPISPFGESGRPANWQ